MQSDQEIPLTGAQRGLVFSATSEGNIVHWPGVRPFNDPSVSSRLVGMNRMMSRLPFQVGTPLPIIEEEGSTEILSSASTAESRTNSTICYAHSGEVFMLRQPLQAPDVNLGDENLSDISVDALSPPNESDKQRAAREKKNKHKQTRRNCANTARKRWSGIGPLVKKPNANAWRMKQLTNSV